MLTIIITATIVTVTADGRPSARAILPGELFLLLLLVFIFLASVFQ